MLKLIFSVVAVSMTMSSFAWAEFSPAIKVKELVGSYKGTVKTESGVSYNVDLQVTLAPCTSKCNPDRPTVAATLTTWITNKGNQTQSLVDQFQTGYFDIEHARLSLHDTDAYYDGAKIDEQIWVNAEHSANGDTLSGYLLTNNVSMINLTKMN